MVSKSGGQTEPNTKITKVIEFFRTKNVNSIGIQRKIKNMLEYRSDSFGNILNLSKHLFSLNTYKLLNKNFFRLLKLRAHFKDANETQISDQLYQPFKVKNKTKWTHKETHHTLKPFIDLVPYDINKIKIKIVKNPKSNLSNGEQEAMKHLAKQRDIIITTADKGGAVVLRIMSKLITNYPIKTNTKNFKQTPPYNTTKRWMIH